MCPFFGASHDTAREDLGRGHCVPLSHLGERFAYQVLRHFAGHKVVEGAGVLVAKGRDDVTGDEVGEALRLFEVRQAVERVLRSLCRLFPLFGNVNVIVTLFTEVSYFLSHFYPVSI